MLKTGYIFHLRPNYGFIKDDDGNSYFLLPSAVQESVGYLYTDLREGQRVEFRAIHDRHKGKPSLRAIEVRLIDDHPTT